MENNFRKEAKEMIKELFSALIGWLFRDNDKDKEE